RDVPVVRSARVDPVGQQHDEQILGGVDPEAYAGEAGVAEGLGGEVVAGAGATGGRVPAERPARCGRLAAGVAADRLRPKETHVAVAAAVQQHLSEDG